MFDIFKIFNIQEKNSDESKLPLLSTDNNQDTTKIPTMNKVIVDKPITFIELVRLNDKKTLVMPYRYGSITVEQNGHMLSFICTSKPIQTFMCFKNGASMIYVLTNGVRVEVSYNSHTKTICVMDVQSRGPMYFTEYNWS
jgi:hypothetical protein